MSKFDEVLEDLYYVIPVGYTKDMIGKTIQTKRLLDFIKQAEKQEKLLELYKELWEQVGRKPEHLQDYELEKRLLAQIKELENE